MALHKNVGKFGLYLTNCTNHTLEHYTYLQPPALCHFTSNVFLPKITSLWNNHHHQLHTA